MELFDNKNSKIYTCSICGHTGIWGPEWSWTEEIINPFQADSSEIQIICCSDKCRKKDEPRRIKYNEKMKKEIEKRFPENNIKVKKTQKNFESMNIISVDPSTITGIYIYTPEKQKSFTKLFKEKDRIKRLGQVVKYFTKIVKLKKWDLLIIEGYAFSSRSQSVTSQAELGGIIRGIFSAFNIPVIEIQIPTWKSATYIKLKKKLKSEKQNYLNTFNTFSSFYKKQIGKENIVFNPSTPDEVDAILFFYSLIVISRGLIVIKNDLKLSKDFKSLNINL